MACSVIFIKFRVCSEAILQNMFDLLEACLIGLFNAESRPAERHLEDPSTTNAPFKAPGRCGAHSLQGCPWLYSAPSETQQSWPAFVDSSIPRLPRWGCVRTRGLLANRYADFQRFPSFPGLVFYKALLLEPSASILLVTSLDFPTWILKKIPRVPGLDFQGRFPGSLPLTFTKTSLKPRTVF